ncbi:MAG: hypothetical protein H0V88_04280 [Pyrinomonadaceae bacterium]|nr:hypothetical protein [Pyrinomonadaceae bacterium]
MDAHRRFPAHGYAGLAIILLAEVLLFSGDALVGRWFTPVIWTGFILFADALLYRFRGSSPLVSNRKEFLLAAIVSVGGWWLFELYNAPRFWRSDLELWWHYHNLEPNPYLRRVGYDWAFATIFPALFITAELFGATLFKNQSNRRPVKISKPFLYGLIFVGAMGAILPLVVVSQWLVPVVWLSWIALLDPLNALRSSPSITGDIARGSYRRLAVLLASGAVCGVLWEFWNYWAITKWTYTVPYFGDVKIFEMPVLGYFGFPPFAVECWAMYIFCRSLLDRRTTSSEHDREETRIWIAD